MTTTPLVLGAMTFGTCVDETTSFALLDRFVEQGGEWIDTADCLSFWASETGHGGQSEAVIGRWLAARPGMETVDAVAELTGSGAVGRVGASNHPAWRIERARRHAVDTGAEPIERPN